MGRAEPIEGRDGELGGVQVIVTRSEGVEGPLTRLLRERGARVLNWPVVAIEPLQHPGALEEALQNLPSYDWIVFTSPRAVAAVTVRRPPPKGRPRVAAVGDATAGQLADAGWRVDLVPSEGCGEALVQEFERIDCAGARVLFPASQIARDTVPAGLTALGARVDRVIAYRTVPAPLDRSTCLAALDSAELPVVTFASPGAVDGLESALGAEVYRRLMAICRVVAIGPTTAEALKESGFAGVTTAKARTLPSLANAVGIAIHSKED
ncbi:MAG: uroporphyrinogen-III synthase [Acidobacteria bacterium]|nr:uroporphyrinogen-III synthase [Acidobacteriota bacterium]